MSRLQRGFDLFLGRIECPETEALDPREDIVGGLGPPEGLGIGVVSLDGGCDGRLEVGGEPVTRRRRVRPIRSAKNRST